MQIQQIPGNRIRKWREPTLSQVVDRMIGGRVKLSPEDCTSIRQQLIAEADAQNVEFPQYRDKFNDYVLGRIKVPILTKLGRAFERGQLVIFELRGEQFVTAYSPQCRLKISISREKITALGV